MSLPKIFLDNFSGKYCLASLCESTTTAVSAYLLTVLVSTKSKHLDIFGLLVLAYMLGFICRGISAYLQERWSMYSVKQLLFFGTSAVRGRTDIYCEEKEQKQRSFILAGNGIDISVNAVDFFCELFTVIVSSSVLLLTLSILITPSIGVSYAFSLCCITALVFHTHKKLGKNAGRIEKIRVSLGQVCSDLWDGFVLGNKIWEKRWYRLFCFSCDQYIRAHIFGAVYAIGVQGMIMGLAYLPTLGVLGWLIWQQTELTILPIVILIPRVMQLLGGQAQLGSMFAGLGNVRGQLRVLKEGLRPPAERNLLKRVNWEEIVGGGMGFGIREFSERVISGSIERGRFTIRGVNGSGKTSILLEIMRCCKERTSYVSPACTPRMSLVSRPKSAGEQMFRMVKELLYKGESKVLLLDEWNANLDNRRRERLGHL